LKSSSLVLLSGEGYSLPRAESEALFRRQDPQSTFTEPEPRVLVVSSSGDPFDVGSRVAFARRVGTIVSSPDEALPLLKGRKVRFTTFDLRSGLPPADPRTFLRGVEGTVDLEHPDLELTLVRGEGEYLAVTSPGTMRQGWSRRRPRSRAFFHPAAIFPKLSRALVNLTRCAEGDVFLDPFAGTGSLAIEAAIIGCDVVTVDRDPKMVNGSLKNMKLYAQGWLGDLRADANQVPLTRVDAIATDVPYGRASSTLGADRGTILRSALKRLPVLLNPGSRMVVMHNQKDAVEETGELALEEEHHLYVHKLLTRTISVLRAK